MIATVIISSILSTYYVPGTDLSARQTLRKKKKKPCTAFHLLAKGAANAVVLWKGNFTVASMALKSVPVI